MAVEPHLGRLRAAIERGRLFAGHGEHHGAEVEQCGIPCAPLQAEFDGCRHAFLVAPHVRYPRRAILRRIAVHGFGLRVEPGGHAPARAGSRTTPRPQARGSIVGLSLVLQPGHAPPGLPNRRSPLNPVPRSRAGPHREVSFYLPPDTAVKRIVTRPAAVTGTPGWALTFGLRAVVRASCRQPTSGTRPGTHPAPRDATRAARRPASPAGRKSRSPPP